MTNEMIEKNRKASSQIGLAQKIVDELIKNPELANFHHPDLSKMGEGRWRGHYISDKLKEINEIYGDNSIKERKNIPEEVQKFVRDAKYFIYGRGN